MSLKRFVLVAALSVYMSALVVAGQERSAQSGAPRTAASDPPCNLEFVAGDGTGGTSPKDAVQELTAQRKRWQSQQPATYRLCVLTLNPLLRTVTEVDVVQGKVRVARRSQSREAVLGRASSDDWSPDVGITVEDLFNRVEGGLAPSPADRAGLRFVVKPSYHPRLGYPVSIYSGPDSASAGRIFDADVTTLARVTPSPKVPLRPATPGEVYGTPKRGRITRPGAAYHTLLGFGSTEDDDRIRLLWPKLASAIIQRGNTTYWDRVKWQPKPGMVGSVVGMFKHSGGQSVYLMEFSHNGETIYYPTGIGGVDLTE
jgi:hypothetical protein